MNRNITITLTAWLLAILNPISALPYYMLTNPKSDSILAKRDAKIMAFASFLILLVWGFFGMKLLWFFWLEIRYFRIAWGVLIAYNAFRMVTGSMPAGHHEAWSGVEDIDWRWLIIPLTMPLVSWPWSIAYVISWFAYGSVYYFPLLIAICIWALSFYLIIRYSIILEKILWKLGIALITRLMGLILLAIGIQTIIMNLY